MRHARVLNYLAETYAAQGRDHDAITLAREALGPARTQWPSRLSPDCRPGALGRRGKDG